MTRIRIGVLGTAEIAFRRFLPALRRSTSIEYAGVASRNIDHASPFIDAFGGRGYGGYRELLGDPAVHAVYVPLPPALHHEWGMAAVEAGKHVLMEKPFTTHLRHTRELVDAARARGLAVHENYMFLYHAQLDRIRRLIEEGAIGDPRLYRATFGFPRRDATDFRYDRASGGGALLDCGGYPLRLAAELLGEGARVTAARLNRVPGFDVDLYGSATLENDRGQVAQIAFGIDNGYRCELEVWGGRGNLLATRIFTAGDGFEPEAIVNAGGEETRVTLPPDDHFLGSIQAFARGIEDPTARDALYRRILDQAALVDRVVALGG
jgi:dTDP-3,4-didehydro-2,6-dideoxy-alpha-D-glucose 3-reductase